MEIQTLENRIKSWELDLHGRVGKKEALLALKNETEIKRKNIDGELLKLDKVMVLFQKTSAYAREQAKMQIEKIVTKCLQHIFGEEYSFQVELNEKRDMANAEFYIVSPYGDDVIVNQPELARGGGVVDIVSLSLRIAFLEIMKPALQGPLLLDEPGKHVSEDYIFNLGVFLSETSNAFNRQMIMVTHNPHLLAIGEQCYIVRQQRGESQVLPADEEL